MAQLTHGRRLGRVAFVLSPGRSGTTLLCSMLAGSPQLFCPPELNLLQHKTVRSQSPLQAFGLYAAFRAALGSRGRGWRLLRRLRARDAPVQEAYECIRQAVHPRMLVEKSPSYSNVRHAFPRMEQLFEEPRYIWLVRHPLAVIDSFERRHWALGRYLKGLSPETAWRGCHLRIRSFLRDHVPSSRFLRVFYERLVAAPTATMHEIASFLGVSYSPSLADPYGRSGGARYTSFAGHLLGGDPWFLLHTRLEPDLADAWRRSRSLNELSPGTLRLAEELGYPASQELQA